MPWRLIIFIVIFAVFLVFITFNLDNRCDINFGFTSAAGIPVFLTIFGSFSFGVLCTLPMVFYSKRKHKEKPLKKQKPGKIDVPSGKQDADGSHGSV